MQEHAVHEDGMKRRVLMKRKKTVKKIAGMKKYLRVARVRSR